MKGEGVKNFQIVINQNVIVKGRGQVKLTHCHKIIRFFIDSVSNENIDSKSYKIKGKVIFLYINPCHSVPLTVKITS